MKLETNFLTAREITPNDRTKLISLCDKMKQSATEYYVWFQYTISQCAPIMILYPHNPGMWNHVIFRAYNYTENRFVTIKIILSGSSIDIYS